jgi:cellulose synthase/poly-beta-1,6-N-acetylglucosamine synthase-like glycosyltransferase
LLGHGSLIRRADCLGLGGFPEIVSEDFAFALRVANAGKHGIYASELISAEAYPFDFGAFMTRLKKFASGTAELLKCEYFKFIGGKASVIEKWDFSMAMLWYILMPTLFINTFLSAYVVHELMESRVPYIHPALPYLYSWVLVAIFAICRSATDTMISAMRFYFWSTAIYTSALPATAWSFIKHFFTGASFKRTPKDRKQTSLPTIETVLSGTLGIFAIYCGANWPSPFTPIIFAHGTAYMSYGLYVHLCNTTRLGKFARILIWLPGLLYLVGLGAVWLYAF